MKIAISGLAGSGKTALAKALQSALFSFNVNAKLVIPSFKEIAEQEGITLEELQKMAEKDPEIDRMFDENIKKMASQGDVIVATWLAVWLIEDADLKVILHAPLEIRARRVAARDNTSIGEAMNAVAKRDLDNRRRYMKLYGIDIFNHSAADLCINSGKFSVDEETEIILRALSVKGLI